MTRKTTDALLFMILLVALAILGELAYGAEAPDSPPLIMYGVAIIGVITVIKSIMTSVSNRGE